MQFEEEPNATWIKCDAVLSSLVKPVARFETRPLERHAAPARSRPEMEGCMKTLIIAAGLAMLLGGSAMASSSQDMMKVMRGFTQV